MANLFQGQGIKISIYLVQFRQQTILFKLSQINMIFSKGKDIKNQISYLCKDIQMYLIFSGKERLSIILSKRAIKLFGKKLNETLS